MLLGLLYFCAACAVATMLWRIIGGFGFDVAAGKARRRRCRHPKRTAYRARPDVSVLVLSSQQGDLLENSVASFRRNIYRKSELMVVGYGISRQQAAAQRRLVQGRSGATTYYHCQEKSRQVALERAIRRYARGDIVLVLDAGMELRADTAQQLVRAFQDYPARSAIVPRVSTRPSYRLAGVLAWYMEILQSGLYKADAVFGVLGTAQPCLAFRRSALSARVGAAYYDPVATVERPAMSPLRMVCQCHRRLLDRWREVCGLWHGLFMIERCVLWLRSVLFVANSLALLMLPVAAGYGLYVAIVLAQPELLFVLVAGASIVLAFALLDQQLCWWRKGLGLLGIPLTFGMLVAAPLPAYVVLLLSPFGLIRHRRSIVAVVFGP